MVNGQVHCKTTSKELVQNRMADAIVVDRRRGLYLTLHLHWRHVQDIEVYEEKKTYMLHSTICCALQAWVVYIA